MEKRKATHITESKQELRYNTLNSFFQSIEAFFTELPAFKSHLEQFSNELRQLNSKVSYPLRLLAYRDALTHGLVPKGKPLPAGGFDYPSTNFTTEEKRLYLSIFNLEARRSKLYDAILQNRIMYIDKLDVCLRQYQHLLTKEEKQKLERYQRILHTVEFDPLLDTDEKVLLKLGELIKSIQK